MIDRRWAELTQTEWAELAEAWFQELRGALPGDVGQTIVLMNFTAPAECQWQFILAAMSEAQSDDDLGHIAAGPFEHLLGKHGEAFISRVEAQALHDQRFARMTTGAWQHTMSASVWSRVQAIQMRVNDPLRLSDAPS